MPLLIRKNIYSPYVDRLLTMAMFSVSLAIQKKIPGIFDSIWMNMAIISGFTIPLTQNSELHFLLVMLILWPLQLPEPDFM